MNAELNMAWELWLESDAGQTAATEKKFEVRFLVNRLQTAFEHGYERGQAANGHQETPLAQIPDEALHAEFRQRLARGDQKIVEQAKVVDAAKVVLLEEEERLTRLRQEQQLRLAELARLAAAIGEGGVS